MEQKPLDIINDPAKQTANVADRGGVLTEINYKINPTTPLEEMAPRPITKPKVK